MLPFKEVRYTKESLKEKKCMLVGDIGGTNSNFGVFSFNHPSKLVYSLHVKSKDITDFTSLVQDVVDYVASTYGLTIVNSCFGAAGVVAELRDVAKPTNLLITIDAKKIKEKTGIPHVVLINDFEAVAYGIDRIAKKDVVLINEGMARAYANKAVIGAGTGLGKGIMGWDERLKSYMPIPSEGGHADCAVQYQWELDLLNFIKKEYNIVCHISWEDILSGKGIGRIYSFLGNIGTYPETEYSKKIASNGLHPDIIFFSRKLDKRCEDTFKFFAIFYGRCAKNFALDALSLGGMYIAGGIAAHNVELFKTPEFMNEFINCGKQRDLLTNVPLYVITDYNVSLYGAAHYLEVVHK